MKEYRVKITIRNNLLLTAIENAGFSGWGGIGRFAEECGISASEVSSFISMRKLPINEDGEFCNSAKRMMEVLGAAPVDLWTEKQLITRLNRNTGQAFLDETSVQRIIETHQETMLLEDSSLETENKEITDVLINVMEGLTAKELEVINRHTAGDETYDELAKSLGVSRERVRQIEAKALRKMRHPKRSVVILDALGLPVSKEDRRIANS